MDIPMGDGRCWEVSGDSLKCAYTARVARKAGLEEGAVGLLEERA